jgi:DNA-binding PadR family transcriptional regulator
MQKQGWIKAGTAVREGNRPERLPYSLTDAGFQELRHRLDKQIREPAWSPDKFFHSVSHLGVLGRTGAQHALQERAAHLKEQMERDNKEYARALAAGTPRLFVVEAEYELHRKHSEIRWVERIAHEIEKGDLKWPKRKR